MISQELIDIFNKAAGLARQKKYEEALVEFDKILSPSKERTKENKERKVVLTGEFLGVAMMRKAWILMDLKRYKEARTVLEDNVMQACLGQFDMPTLYEYFFSLANVLGELGDMKGMDDKGTRALNIASQELGDIERSRTCWGNMMTYATRKKDWTYLEKLSTSARTFAINTPDPVLKVKAEWNHLVALSELGRNDDALEEGEVLLTYLQQVGAEDAAKGVRELLDEMKEKERSAGASKKKDIKKKKKKDD